MTDFIAEICSNHNGNLDRALNLVDTAAAIGCSGVKFQLFRIDKLFAPEALAHPDYQHLLKRREWEMPLDWLPVLATRCKERGIKFGCTPFDLEAVEQLAPFVDFYKIASYNILDHRLIEAVAKEGKPVMLSTGMATTEEIKKATRIILESCNDLTVMGCVSEYPTKINNFASMVKANLLIEATYTEAPLLGWSDHTVDSDVIYWWSTISDIIEFHLDLEGAGYEYNIGHCWLPEQIAPVIKNVLMIQEEEIDVLFSNPESRERLWRADPADGLRPVREIREMLR